MHTTQPDLFTHARENRAENEEIYEKNKIRLSRNTRIIFWAMVEGSEVTGFDLQAGVKNSSMDTYVRMSEYRKRISEILAAGIELKIELIESGCKRWSIPVELRKVYEERYSYVPKS